MEQEAGCVFCDRELILDDILCESENFFVKVGIGLAAPGHVLLIPKEHYRCYADIPSGLEGELGEMKERLSRLISEKFSRPYIVEYGVWGQSVPHAHLHFIPSTSAEYGIESLVDEMVRPGAVPVEVTTPAGLREIYLDEGVYVSIEEQGTLYACHVKGITRVAGQPPPLSIRDFLCDRKGVNGVRTWQNLSDEERLLDEEKRALTKKMLSALRS